MQVVGEVRLSVVACVWRKQLDDKLIWINLNEMKWKAFEAASLNFQNEWLIRAELIFSNEDTLMGASTDPADKIIKGFDLKLQQIKFSLQGERSFSTRTKTV